MKLKYIKINGYKNLDFKITFPDDGVAVLIGNNGSGKSNVLEAISLVFGYYYDNSLIDKPNFDYVIRYEKDGQNITLTQNTEQIDISKLPEKIICYYSGEEARLWNDIYKKFYEKENQKYIDKKNTASPKIPELLFVNKYYWKIAFILLSLNNRLFDYDISNSKYLIQKNKKNIKTWKQNIKEKEIDKKNLILEFVDNLPENNSISKLSEIENNLDELFLKFYFSYMPKNDKLIEDIKIDNIKKDNINLNFQDFSEGEKRLILYKFIIEFLATQDILLLFDEIDNNIHPANKKQFLNMLNENFNDEMEKSVIFSTHSPTFTTLLNEKSLFMMDNGSIISESQKEIIKKLTENKWSYFEINEILTTNEDIVLVEGEIDRLYLEETLKIFKNNGEFRDLNLKFIPTGGADNNMEFFIENLTLKEGQKLFVLLDNDESGRKSKNKLSRKFNDRKNNVIILTLPRPSINFNENEWEIEDFFDKRVIKKIAKENYKKQIHNNLNSFPKLNDKKVTKVSIKRNLKEEFKKFIKHGNSLIKMNYISKFKNIFKTIEKIKNETK